MSNIKLQITTKATTQGTPYRSWRLTVSAKNAENTAGETDDNNIFVFAVTKWSTGERNTFSHIATLHDMVNLPESRADIPLKSTGYFRSSILELEFHNKRALDRAVSAIKADVSLLMDAAAGQKLTNTETVSL